jgi:hypothetical protein
MNSTLLATIKALNPTEGEWIESWGTVGTEDEPLFDVVNAEPDDRTLITLAPAMRQELLKMEEAYNIVKELAQWAKKYPRDKVYHVSQTMDDELIALEEKAKQFINTNPINH